MLAGTTMAGMPVVFRGLAGEPVVAGVTEVLPGNELEYVAWLASQRLANGLQGGEPNPLNLPGLDLG